MTGTALTLVLGITLTACRADRAPAAGGALAVVDDAGDTVRLGAPARRIVSLIPTTTEILLSAGLGDRVVGRTEWCDWPATVGSIPSVGGGFPPNVEAVAARAPDLVVLYHTAVTGPAAAQLEALGIPVVELRTDRLADVPRVARLLGVLAGASAAGEALAREFERGLADASAGLSAHRAAAIPVLLLAWPDPTVALGAGAFMSELLELAGGRNVFGDVPSASAPVSLESIVARDPEAVFLADSAAGAALTRPEWRTVRAVRAGRVITPLPPALTRAGLRAPLAVRQLRRRLAELNRSTDAASLNVSRSKALP
ncbi:MAG: ABC transporter substrate-binding protein [Gemmatimonadales bacterium]